MDCGNRAAIHHAIAVTILSQLTLAPHVPSADRVSDQSGKLGSMRLPSTTYSAGVALLRTITSKWHDTVGYLRKQASVQSIVVYVLIHVSIVRLYLPKRLMKAA
jgi:hypothetical protein